MIFPAVSAEYIVDLYHRYIRDPKSVDPSWFPYFEELWGRGPVIGKGPEAALEVGAAALVAAYRLHGHMAATLDPLGLWYREAPRELDPAFHGIAAIRMDSEISGDTAARFRAATPRALLARLIKIYSGTIGFQCGHMDDDDAREWFYAAAESGRGSPSAAERRSAAYDVIAATQFEHFFSRRFLAKKRFGADGAESMVAWLNALLARSASNGVRDVVIGGTARGRLNVMANVVSKPLTALLHEFKGRSPFPSDVKASGDVPYHFGHVGERNFGDATISLTYCHNPSHLEAIDGVAAGRVRARQDAQADQKEAAGRVLGLQIHTDAAFAGQGVVGEVLQLSQLPAYHTGGTIHFVINNQVGFTTNPNHARSSVYCTDIARVIGAPVLHVNADDVDAVIRTAHLAAEYRARFSADIVVDFVCYRRYGHNEVDEPTFTQPVMYRRIADHPTVAEQYIPRVLSDGVLPQEDSDAFARRCFDDLDAAYGALEGYRPTGLGVPDGASALAARGKASRGEGEFATGLDLQTLARLGEVLSSVPAGINVNAKIAKQMKERGAAVSSGHGVNWATAEALSLGSMAAEGIEVRFSGQDTPRGAFSQRHFLVFDQLTGEVGCPFDHIGEEQARCRFVGTPLSEYSVLGFEYGYSMDSPRAFTMWEAQFGDFANVAQVIFDQFISSGEDKWLDVSGLTVMLPHGLEGQGPDHSSARIERFLQMCADGNMTVANCSTPANLFHLLRRQAHASPRKPLLVFTTKSLLRHRASDSELAAFGPGTKFKPVLAPAVSDDVCRVVLCSGKIAYDIEAALANATRDDVAVVRIEQLYPFPEKELQAKLERFPRASVVWCQEEPENMGAWAYVDRKIEKILRGIGNTTEWPSWISRPANASTAIGTNEEHIADQARLVAKATGFAQVRGDKLKVGRR
ncbi:MAG: 2-oxoglutarate dehydrogenase E1 component [Beijerinckiaceae bacterium]